MQLYNVFTPEKTLEEFKTLYVKKVFFIDIYSFLMLLFIRYFVLSFSDFDLNKVIRRQKPLTEKHVKLIIYSLLRGLKVQCVYSVHVDRINIPCRIFLPI